MRKGSSNKIKILIVDDQPLFRSGLESLLTLESDLLEIVGSVGDGKKAVEFCKKNKVDVVLMDIEMPVMDGIEAMQKIKSTNPKQNILVLSMHDEDSIILNCLKVGANGFLSKATDVSELVDAILSITDSGYYFNLRMSKIMVSGLLGEMKAGKEVTALTDREIEIIRLMSKEYTAREIADKLQVSLRTIDNYRERIIEKTGAKNTIGVVVYAIKNKLINVN